MASLGRQVPPQAQPVFDNPFSIKSILNLSDETNDKCAETSNEKSPPIIPIVPQPIRSLVGFNMETGLSSYRTAQWLTAASHFPPWLLGTRFMRFLPGATTYLQRRRNQRKRKQRPLFTQHQVHTLEQEFARHRYVSEVKRAELSSKLNLTETQVKTWFQNRRTKWRKEARDELETALMDTKRRWKEETGIGKNEPSSSSKTEESTQLFIDLDNYKLRPTSHD